MLKVLYCGSGIGSNEQGEYCRAVLRLFNCLNRDINDLLYFTLLLTTATMNNRVRTIVPSYYRIGR